MRLARDFGTVSELFPDEFRDLRDIPHTLFDLIRHALVFLSFDELPEDEVPPRRIWTDGEKLRDWFSDVRRKRRRELDSEPIEDPVDNEAALIHG